MRQLVAFATIAALSLTLEATLAAAQGLPDPRRDAKSMIDVTLGFSMITGQVGDSLKSGPGLEASYQYQLQTIPLRLGAGVGYSRHGLEEPADDAPVPVEGSSNKWSVFALGSLLLFGNDTDMIPYMQARLGYTKFFTSSNDVDIEQGGLELSALVGVDLPVAEAISIDVAGMFGWINSGDQSVDGVSVPGTSRTGSEFSIRAGAFFYF